MSVFDLFTTLKYWTLCTEPSDELTQQIDRVVNLSLELDASTEHDQPQLQYTNLYVLRLDRLSLALYQDDDIYNSMSCMPANHLQKHHPSNYLCQLFPGQI